MKNEGIFRKKSLERVQSPDNLNEYVRVTGPGMWLLLAGMIALLIGALVWGIFGQVDTVVKLSADVRDGNVYCYADGASVTDIHEGTRVKIGDTNGRVAAVSDEYESGRGRVCVIETETVLADGLYTAEIVIERSAPISFVLN